MGTRHGAAELRAEVRLGLHPRKVLKAINISENEISMARKLLTGTRELATPTPGILLIRPEKMEIRRKGGGAHREGMEVRQRWQLQEVRDCGLTTHSQAFPCIVPPLLHFVN